jgi:hypothetical protein
MSDQPQQEDDIVPARRLLQVYLGVIIVGISLALVAWLVLFVDEGHFRPSHRFPEHDLPPPHRVSEIREELFETIKVSDENLDSYQRIDRTHARIPIDRAIDLLLKGMRP